jgi:flagellar basal body-associated protein FliL
MKRIDSLIDKILGPSRLVRILLLLLLGLAVLIAAGSAVAFALGLPGKDASDDQGPSWQRERSGAVDGLESFSRIGSLRVRSADKKPFLLSVTIVLGIPAGDAPFREELIAKTPELKAACLKILGAKNAAELSPAFEGGIKAQLRDVMNSQLVLGRIEAVYFTVYQLIE